MTWSIAGSEVPNLTRWLPALRAALLSPRALASAGPVGLRYLQPDQSERKLATVLVADLVGSTELGGSMDPERTRAMLERFYETGNMMASS